MPELNDKAMQLAHKLKELADRGEGGEQRNAQQLLEAHLKRHGITLDQLESPERTERLFKMPKGKALRTVLQHCIASSLQSEHDIFMVGRPHTHLMAEMSAAEYAEALAKWETHRPHFEAMHQRFVLAYILQNDLTRKVATAPELSKEEQAERSAAALMGMGIDRKQHHLRLNAPTP